MSYIGENGAGYVCAGRDGKIYIRVLGEDQDEMPLNLLKTYKKILKKVKKHCKIYSNLQNNVYF